MTKHLLFYVMLYNILHPNHNKPIFSCDEIKFTVYNQKKKKEMYK